MTPTAAQTAAPDLPPHRDRGALLVDWISRRDLALELGLTEDTLRRWADRRAGPPSVRAGRQIFYRRAAVLAWLEGQERPCPGSGRGRR